MLPGMDGELLSIGRFARLSGLSVGALRHYHQHGLLVPASVDPVTGYRSYTRAQADEARLIGSLRELGLPLPRVRAALAADPAERRAMLAAHRTRLGALLARTQRQIHWLNRAIDHEEPIMIPSPPAPLDVDARRRLAADLFNRTWTLMERADRTAAQDDEMLHCAHASRYHWGEVGEPANRARGEWQCSRVYTVLGRAEPAMWHARRCLALCEEHGIVDWDIAFAWEAIARAASIAGDEEETAAAMTRARELGALISEDEDRELLLSDLATIDARPMDGALSSA
jgi:DNA-binding transcriptional MerR regulator